jgi:hypothetical protein
LGFRKRDPEIVNYSLTRARENPANPAFFARGDFAKTPNPLIFLDSTIRQSTGFDRSASSNGIKSQFIGIFGANFHAGAKLQPRRAVQKSKFGEGHRAVGLRTEACRWPDGRA